MRRETFVSAAREGAARYAAQQLEQLRRFSQIDHGTGNVEGNRAVIQVMSEILSHLNVTVEYPENAAGCRHVLARYKPDRSTGTIVLNSHIDTVFKPGDAAAHPFRVENGEAWGLGIADCMGGFVVSTYAMRIMQEAGLLPDKEIVLFYNCDEEIGSPSSRDIFRLLAKEAEMVFVFEGAREENGVLTYRKGAADGKIEVTGKESHAGLKYTEGSSATVELAHQILQLTAMSDPEKEMYYNVGPLTGGTGTCVVAGHASAGIAVSPPDSASYEKICADMRKLEENVTVKGCTVKAHMDLIFPSMERTEGNVRVYQLVHEAGTLMGLDLPEQASGGSSDACYFTTYGAPTVDGLGPYLHDIHTFNERLDIASIQEKTQLFATVLGLLGEQ